MHDPIISMELCKRNRLLGINLKLVNVSITIAKQWFEEWLGVITNDGMPSKRFGLSCFFQAQKAYTQ